MEGLREMEIEFEKLNKVIKELPEGEAKLFLLHILKKVYFLNEKDDWGFSEEKFVKDIRKVYKMILTNEKAEKKEEGPFKMIHILFSLSAAGTFKNVLKNLGLLNEEKVISFWEMFSVGPIWHLHDEIGQQARFDWMEKIHTNENSEFDEYKEYFQKALNQIKSIPESVPITIWTSESAHEQTGLRFVLHLLKDRNNSISVINTTKEYNELFQKRKVKYTVLHSGEIIPEKLQLIYEQGKGENFTDHDIEEVQKEWQYLADNQDNLRLWRNGRIHCVSEDYLDEFIVKAAKRLHGKTKTKVFIKSARLIGEVLGHLDQFVGDSFLEYRLKKMIEAGVFEAEGSLEAMRLYSIRLKQ